MKRIIFSAILLAFLTGQAISATAVVTENTATGLKSWKIEDRGFSLELVQLLPEFAQATYDSRQGLVLRCVGDDGDEFIRSVLPVDIIATITT